MGNSKEERTYNDSPAKSHTAVQTREDKTTEKYFLAEGSNNDGCSQDCVRCDGRRRAVCEQNLVIRLQVQVKACNHKLIKIIDANNYYYKYAYPAKCLHRFESAEAQSVPGLTCVQSGSMYCTIGNIEGSDEKSRFNQAGNDECQNGIQ